MLAKIKYAMNPLLWSELYRDYLIGFAMQNGSNYIGAEKLVQETFLSAANAREKHLEPCGE